MSGIRKMLPFVGLILIFVGLSICTIFYAESTWRRDFKVWLGLAVTAVGALLVLWGVYGRAFGPNLKYHVSYALTSAFVIGSLAMVYLIARNHSFDWDVTEKKLHSLHPRTIEYLRDLDRDVTISAFISSVERADVDRVLERYSRYSPRITHEVRNPIKENNYARRFAENVELGDVFIWTGTRAEGEKPASTDFREKKIRVFRPQDLTESKLTNAIVEVMRPDRVKVYFLTGHGEISRERQFGGMMGAPSSGRASYSNVEALLKEEMAFDVADLQIRDVGYVPDDCSLLVCAGPKSDLFPLEVEAITRYLARGNRALFLLDPTRRRLVRFEGFQALLVRFGVQIQPDAVLENNPLAQLTGDPTLLLVDRFGTHQTVNNPVQPVQMSYARTVARLDSGPSTVTVSELLYSSRMSWAESVDKLLVGREIELPDASRMKEQPLAVAASAEGGLSGEHPMRMVVFGDSDIFENSFYASSDWLLANVVNWLVAREDLIDIPPKQLEDTAVPPSIATMRVLFILFALVLPGVVVFGGLGYVFVRRQVR